jgi:hypothetical protein
VSNHKLKIEDLQELANEYKGKYIDEVPYVNTHTKVKWECKRGHRFLAETTQVKQKRWCKICREQDKLDELSEIAQKRKGVLISDTYLHSMAAMVWKCEKGHTFVSSENRVRLGKFCIHCDSTVPKAQLTTRYRVRMFVSGRGGKILTKGGISTKSTIKLSCRHGHEFDLRVREILENLQWCTHCKAVKENPLEFILDTDKLSGRNWGVPNLCLQ